MLMVAFIFMIGLTVGSLIASPILWAVLAGLFIGAFILKTC